MIYRYDDSKAMTMQLVVAAGSYYAPKEDLLKPKGEDAHFISQEKQTVGVADGVSRWAEKGIDSGKYARKLMKNSLAALTRLKPHEPVDPTKILKRAYDDTKVEGTSTACIVTLKENKLQYANVGDSGFAVFRENRCVYVLPMQTRGFNYPYQLGNGPTGDRPKSAYVNEFEVEANDVVVVGTDGLFDNIYPWEIQDILSQTDNAVRPEEIASIIGAVALANSVNKKYVSPFELYAAEANHSHSGGKYGDITVVVALIQSLE